MPIRFRFALIFILGFLSLYFGQRFYVNNTMEKAFLSVENDDIRQSLERINQAVESEKNYLISKGTDWGIWDDPYFFLLGQNKNFINSNFSDPKVALQSIRIHFMIFVDRSNRVAYSVHVNKEESKVGQVSEGLSRLILQEAELDKETSGFLKFKDEVIFFASRPVVRSDGEGSSAGLVILGEYVDESFQNRIQATSQLPVQFAVASKIGNKSSEKVEFLNKEVANLTKYFSDLDGQAVLMARTDYSRRIYSTFLKTSEELGQWIFVGMALVALVTIYTLIFQVFKPIKDFVSWQSALTKSDSWKKERYPQKFQLWKIFPNSLIDELAEIVDSSNRLLDKIESSNQLIEKQTASLVNAEKHRTLGEMSAGIAHEINNPLMIIMIMAGKLKKIIPQLQGDDSSREKIMEPIRKIEGTVERIKRIIDGLLRFARDASNDEFVLAEAHLPIEDASELIRENLNKKNVELKLDLEKGLWIQARPGQLAQVIYNLMNNSMDAISGQERTWIAVSCKQGSIGVVIEVKDSGPGIPAEIREKIFNPFFTTKEVGKGTGLGLSISQGIIGDHHGRIYIDSNQPHTCFTIELPLADRKVNPRSA
jgi:signal transduction histidine kinase